MVKTSKDIARNSDHAASFHWIQENNHIFCLKQINQHLILSGWSINGAANTLSNLLSVKMWEERLHEAELHNFQIPVLTSRLSANAPDLKLDRHPSIIAIIFLSHKIYLDLTRSTGLTWHSMCDIFFFSYLHLTFEIWH